MGSGLGSGLGAGSGVGVGVMPYQDNLAVQAWVEVLFYEQVASVRSSLVFPILRIKIYLAFHNKSYLIALK